MSRGPAQFPCTNTALSVSVTWLHDTRTAQHTELQYITLHYHYTTLHYTTLLPYQLGTRSEPTISNSGTAAVKPVEIVAALLVSFLRLVFFFAEAAAVFLGGSAFLAAASVKTTRPDASNSTAESDTSLVVPGSH
jgi:hypothetical protein